MKKIILSLLLTSFFGFNYAQTNVSGGIFSNTTWSLAGSPYIVVDTTVVFPGVTLTIEPGVLVKFDDHMYLEIRQATLIANGTITDSITFTSNNPLPSSGIWGAGNNGGIWLNNSAATSYFNFCNISYASMGLANVQHIKNSSFLYNQVGIGSLGQITVDSCVIKYTATGIWAAGIGNVFGTTLNYCTISNNSLGIDEVYNAVLNHCTLDSNGAATGGATGHTDNTKFYNCSISHNHQGALCGSMGKNLFRNCTIDYNTITGIAIGNTSNDSIIDCEIKFNNQGVWTQSNTLIMHCDVEYNATGIIAGYNNLLICLIAHCDIENDTVGVQINGATVNMYCNKICNNVSYGLKMGTSSNFNASNNYWCTNDSTQIAAAIYDGYDNVSYGLVTFLPTDSTCYQSTGINEIAHSQIGFSIFPNPTTGTIQLTFSTKHNAPLHCEIINIMGEKVYAKQLETRNSKPETTLDVSFLAKGIYVVRVGDEERWENKKLVVE